MPCKKTNFINGKGIGPDGSPIGNSLPPP